MIIDAPKVSIMGWDRSGGIDLIDHTPRLETRFAFQGWYCQPAQTERGGGARVDKSNDGLFGFLAPFNSLSFC